MKLFHGSREEIQGKRILISKGRVSTDFGRGFYMGDNDAQAKNIIVNGKKPCLYVFNLDIDKIPRDKVLYLSGDDWLYTVLYNRGHLDKLKGTAFYEKYKHILDGKDIVIGRIADDSMKVALDSFTNGIATSEGVKACLEAVDLGIQYVIKRQPFADTIKVPKGHRLTPNEISEAKMFFRERAEFSEEKAGQIIRQHIHEGFTIDQVVEKHMEELIESGKATSRVLDKDARIAELLKRNPADSYTLSAMKNLARNKMGDNKHTWLMKWDAEIVRELKRQGHSEKEIERVMSNYSPGRLMVKRIEIEDSGKGRSSNKGLPGR